MKYEKPILTILVLVVVFLALRSCFNYSSNVGEIKISNKERAYYTSQSLIKQALKSPTSAEFPIYKDIEVIEFEGLYTVNAYVDSDNSFGANIRTQFTVQLTLTYVDDFDLNTIYMDKELVYPTKN